MVLRLDRQCLSCSNPILEDVGSPPERANFLWNDESWHLLLITCHDRNLTMATTLNSCSKTAFRMAIGMMASLIPALAMSTESNEAWSVSGGLSYQEVHFTRTGSAYNQESWAATGYAYRPVGDWFVGGIVSYNTTRTANTETFGQSRPKATSLGGFAGRMIAPGLFAGVSLNYGNITLDGISSNGITYTTYGDKTKFLTSSVSLTQSIPLSSELGATLGARYTLVDSRSKGYIDSNGTAVAGLSRHWGFMTLGGALNWNRGEWQFSLKGDWHRANTDFVPNTGDRDYFKLGAGVTRHLSPRTSLSAGYETAVGKKFTRENTYLVNMTHRF